MTTDRLDRSITEALEAEAPPVAPSELLDNAMELITDTPQRRAAFELSFASMVGVAAAVAVVLIVAFQVGRTGTPPGGTDASDAPLPTPTPVVGPTTTPLPSLAPASENTLISIMSLRATVDLPPGWRPPRYFSGTGTAQWFECCVEGEEEAGMTFAIVDSLTLCQGPGSGSVDADTSIDDLVTALNSHSEYEATDAERVTIDGVEGVRLQVTLTQEAGSCSLSPAFPTGTPGVESFTDIWIFDVQGTTFVATGWEYIGCVHCEPGTPSDYDLRSQIVGIVESLEFQR